MASPVVSPTAPPWKTGLPAFLQRLRWIPRSESQKTGQKDSNGVVQIICIAYSQSMLQRLFELSLSLFRSWHLMFGVRLTARDQSVIDAGANVVHAFSRSDFDGEGQQELDEATPDDDFLGEFGLLIELGDDNQGKFCGVVAVTNLSEESREAFFTNIEGELPGLRGVGIGRTVFSGFLLAEYFLGKLVAIEVLYGLCGVGQNLDDTVVDANFYVVHNAVLVIYEKMGK